MPIDNIFIVGAGLMGAGIAQVPAWWPFWLGFLGKALMQDLV